VGGAGCAAAGKPGKSTSVVERSTKAVENLDSIHTRFQGMTPSVFNTYFTLLELARTI
jgi:hypothetical protein